MKKQIEDITPLLGPFVHASDKEMPFILSNNNYEWYYTFGYIFKPKSIIELGVRRGYSIISMALGHPGISTLFLIDNEFDGIRLDEGIQNIRQLLPNIPIVGLIEDTQALLSIPEHLTFDLAHIDAYHTFEGVQKELSLCHRHINPMGIIIIDDTKVKDIHDGVLCFLGNHPEWKIFEEITESLTGQTILEKTSEPQI